MIKSSFTFLRWTCVLYLTIISKLATGQIVDPNFGEAIFRKNIRQIETIKVLSDGSFLVKGPFDYIDGQPQIQLMHLNKDLSRDINFSIPDNVAGYISDYGFDVQADDKIIASGNFFNEETGKTDYLARLNKIGSIDSTFQSGVGPNDYVSYVKVLSDNSIFLFGGFSSYDNIPVDRVALLNPDGTLNMDFQVPSEVIDQFTFINLAQQLDGKLLIVNTSYSSQTKVYRLFNDGSLDSLFNPPSYRGNFNDIKVTKDDKILLAGHLTELDVFMQRGLVKLNSDGSLDSTFNFVENNGYTRGMYLVHEFDEERILVAGYLPNVDTDGSSLIMLKADGSIDNSFNGTGFKEGISYGTFNSLTVDLDNQILIGGSFSNYKNEQVNGLALLNESANLIVFDNLNLEQKGEIHYIEPYENGQLIIAGDFQWYNEHAVNGIIRINADASLDTTFNVGTGAPAVIKAIRQPDGKIIIGSYYDEFNNTPAKHGLLRLNHDGSRDNNFNVDLGHDISMPVFALQEDGKIVIGAPQSAGQAQTITRLNTDGSVDSLFDKNYAAIANPYDLARHIIVQSDGKIMVSIVYNKVDNTTRYLLRLNADGTMDTTFPGGQGPDERIIDLDIDQDQYLMHGFFHHYNGNPVPRIIRIHNDGSLDESFDGQYLSNHFFHRVYLPLDGVDGEKAILAGEFEKLADKNIYDVVVLNNDGSVDSTVVFPVPDHRISQFIKGAYSEDNLVLAQTSSQFCRLIKYILNPKPPEISNINKESNEDNIITFNLDDFIQTFTDENGDSLFSIQIKIIPDNGILLLGKDTVLINEIIDASSIDNLQFIPTENWFGEINFAYAASDGVQWSTHEANIFLTIHAINDAPTIASIEDQTILQGENLRLPVIYHDVDTDLTSLFFNLMSSNESLLAGKSNQPIDSDTLWLTLEPDITQAGETTCTVEISDGELKAATSFQLTVMPVLGIKEPENEVSLQIHPNPATDQLQITWKSPNKGEGTLFILDTSGKILSQEIFDKKAYNFNERLPIDHLPQGVYLIKINLGSQRSVHRLVKH